MNPVTRNNPIRSAIVVLIFLPVLYVACFGPACWLDQRFAFGRPVISVVYRPAFMLLITSSSTLRPARTAAIWYMRLGEAGPMQPVLNRNAALEDWGAIPGCCFGGDGFRSAFTAGGTN